MANSNDRKPFRPLGLRMLNLSRQIIQTYAATDPIAREMLPRATQEPNYEPLTWDEGEDDSFADEQQWQTSETEDYGSMFPDLQPPQKQRSQPSQPVQRKPQQPSQPAQPAKPTKPAADNPHRLVDVGGVKVPAHVVQAMRNYQEREAQREQNKQKLVDQSNQSGQADSILAKRQQRGRGMSVDYLSTDTLRKDDEQSSPKVSSANSESDDADSHLETPTSNSPPAADAPIMREMDSDTAQDADYDDDYDESYYQTAYPVAADFVDNAPVADNQPSIQRAYDDGDSYDELADDNYFADDDSGYSDVEADNNFAPPSYNAPISRTNRQQPSVQRDFEDANDSDLYSDFEHEADNSFDASVSDTSSDAPISRSNRQQPSIQRKTESDAATGDTPVNRTSRNSRSIQRTPDFEQGDNALYSDFEAEADAGFDAPMSDAGNDVPISRTSRNNRSIQRTPDFEQSDSDLYSDFETDADNSFDAPMSDTSDTPISRTSRNNRSIQRTPDFEQGDSDLYNDFESEADVSDTSDAPSRTSRSPRSIQRTPDFEDANSSDLYSDFDTEADAGFDAPMSDAGNDAPISRTSRNNRSVQRTPDFEQDDNDLYSDFEAEADAGFDAPIGDTSSDAPISRTSRSPRSIQRTPDFEDANEADLYSDFESEADSDFDAPVSRNQPASVQRQTDYEAVDADFYEVGEPSQPLSRPVIGNDYYDNALQTDRMRAITDADIAAYDKRQEQTPTQSSQPTIQRSPTEDYDDSDLGYDDSDDYGGSQPDLHEALFAAGAVDTPPPSFGQRIQRSPSLYDDLTPDDADSDYNPEQDTTSLYDDFASDNNDTGYASAQSSIQRSPDDEENIGSGNLQSDLLSLMGLSPDTKVAGFDDVFGKSGDKGSDASAAPMIQRVAEPPPSMVQRAETSSSSASASSSTSPSSTTDEGERQKIEDMAQKVYKNLKQRLRIEWERRNRF